MGDETPALEGMSFVAGDRPAVYWSWESRRLQKDYLDGIDPEYFAYQIDLLVPELGGTNAQRSAVAIRTYYSQALETLFALLGASIQSPGAPAPWMLHYQNADLVFLLEAIDQGEAILNRLRLERIGWKEITKVLTPWSIGDATEGHIEAMTTALRRLAHEYLSDGFSDEYNSIKHGLRVRPGGSFLSVGVEDTPGVPAPPEKMRTLYSYEFGASFLKANSLKGKKFQYGFQRTNRNWELRTIRARTSIVCACIVNLLAFLKLCNGFESDSIPVSPLTVQQVDESLYERMSFQAFTMNMPIDADCIEPCTRDEILDTYEQSTHQ